MKELNHFFFEKGHFTSIKGHFLFTKGHSDNPEGLMDVDPPSLPSLIENYF